MNERIRQLAHEAGLPTYNPEGIPTKLEKFAELIVRECMRMCEVTEMSFVTHDCDVEASGAITVKQFIAEHFGVES
jgi:hypothetical protein